MSLLKKLHSLSSKDVNSCNKCSITFSKKHNFRRHIRRFHPEENIITQLTRICGICKNNFRSMKQFHDHISDSHKITLTFEKKTFYSEIEFNAWKSSTEKNSISFFTVKRTEKNSDDTIDKIYECNRSGRTAAKTTNRKRHSKYSGSIKTGYTCPAMMKVHIEMVHEAQLFEVEFQSVHVGHDLDEHKLRLSYSERNKLASLLSEGTTPMEIRDKILQHNSKKLNLKDIHNIRRDFLLDMTILMDDSKKVDNMVEELKMENCVLVHKPVGNVLTDYPEIAEQDFLLGIMNEQQQLLIEFHGTNCIIVDSKISMSPCIYHITTLLVKDGHQVFPVAVLFYSNAITETYIPFLDGIKQRCPFLKTDILLSSDTDIFYNAWRRVFGDYTKHFLCSQHVKNHCGFHLISKVKQKDKRDKMRKDLYDILSEQNTSKFERLWNTFLDDYKDEEAFISHLKTSYESRKMKWAQCYRNSTNANLKLEKWHKQFNKNGENGNSNFLRRLDVSLKLVLQEITKIYLNRITSMEHGWTNRKAHIQNRHTLSVIMGQNGYDVKEIEPRKRWIVIQKVSESNTSYEVNVGIQTCNCDIICMDCNVCINQMTCTCVDYNMKYVICKHIHFVCKRFNVSNWTNTQIYCNDVKLQIVDDYQLLIAIDKQPAIQKVIVVQRQSSQISKEKQDLSLCLQDINDQVQRIESYEQLQNVKHQIDKLKSYMDATSGLCELSSVRVNKMRTSTKKFKPA